MYSDQAYDNVRLDAKQKAWVQNHVITVGVEQWEPMVYVNQKGDIDGIAGDIVKLLEKRLGIKIKVIHDKWDALLNKFKEKKIDLLPATYYTKERAAYGIYSKEYFKMKEYIYVKTDNNTIHSFSDLKGKKIAIIKDYGTIPKIRKKFPTVKIIETKDMQQSVNFVLEGKVDALIDAQIGVENFIAKHVIVGLKGIYQDSFKASPLYFFSNPDKPILAKILQKGLSSITIFETEKIVRKWLNRENAIFTSKIVLTPSEMKYLMDKKNIKLCIDPNWMPFEAMKNGEYTGLASDYMHKISDMINIPFVPIKSKSWKESLRKGKKRECDMFPIISITKERKQYLNFTQPYLEIPIVFATKASSLYIGDIEKILNKKIAVVRGYSVGDYLKKQYPKVNIVYVDSIQEGLRDVENGKVFAYMDNLASVNYEIQKDFLGIISISGRLDKKIKYRSGTRSDEPLLDSIISKAISNIDNSTKVEIFNKWVAVRNETRVDYSNLYKLLGLFSLFFLISFYRQRVLKKHSRNLEELNNSLEKRIEEAVRQAQQKDQQLLHQSRLAQMGEMISMIAHQWRQPLTAISAASGAISLKAKLNKLDKETTIELANKISSYSQHLSSTINDFRDFFKSNKEKKKTSYDEIVNNVLGIIGISIKNKNIKIIKNLNTHEIFESYPNELKQVVMNLIKNAEDILIEKEIKNPTIQIKTYKEKEKLVLEISDNGGGIPEDIISKIFDPYFSTKTKKDGTGLGLYMSKIIIEEHCNGELSMTNDSQGAIFRIKL